MFNTDPKQDLPVARICCDLGRIRVGDRVYKSASEALTAYLKQFESSPQSSMPAMLISTPFSLNALVQKSQSLSQPVTKQYSNHVNNTHAAFVTNTATTASDGGKAYQKGFNWSTFPNTPASQAQVLNGLYTGGTAAQKMGVSSLPQLSAQSDTGNICEQLPNHSSLSGKHLINGIGIGTPNQSMEGNLADVSRARSEVETLLCTQPSREIELQAQDTLREVKLKRLLQEAQKRANDANNKSYLQQEVEEALLRSAQLLDTIKTEPSVSPHSVSDVSSLNTETLLSINPYKPSAYLGSDKSRQSRSRHRYSYRSAQAHHSRSVSLNRISSFSTPTPPNETGRRRSIESLEPEGMTSYLRDKLTRDGTSSGSNHSAMSDPSDIQKHLQNHSTSQVAYSFPRNKGADHKLPHHNSPPSWVNELILPSTKTNESGPSDLVDFIFSVRDETGAHPAPSWVNGIDQSDVGSFSMETPGFCDTSEALALAGMTGLMLSDTAQVDESRLTDLSLAGPGLNYSDLVSSPAVTKHKVSFSRHLQHPTSDIRKKMNKSQRNNTNNFQFNNAKNAETHQNNAFLQDLTEYGSLKPSDSPVHLNSSLNMETYLHNKVIEDSLMTKHALDEFMSQLNAEESHLGTNHSDESSRERLQDRPFIPRCSSLDRLHDKVGPENVYLDIAGTSSITKDSNFSNKICLDDPSFTPSKPAVGNDHSPESDDLLEGDRPWESFTAFFKAPVHIGTSTSGGERTQPSQMPMLSGGNQPGSMEALKKMLFRLQKEESSSTSSTLASSTDTVNGEAASLIPALKDYNFEDEPGGQSLERALVHLGRLKTLVQNKSTASKECTSTDSGTK